MKRKLVYVKWLDHHNLNDSGWKDFDELVPHVMEMESVGWVMCEDKNYLVLAAHMNEKHQTACGEIMIIKKCILNRQEIVLNE